MFWCVFMNNILTVIHINKMCIVSFSLHVTLILLCYAYGGTNFHLANDSSFIPLTPCFQQK